MALKSTDRAGWKLAGVALPESVADHTFGVAILAWILAPRMDPPLDRDRCVAIALIHDLAEAIVGDITPYDGVPPDEKRRREEAAMYEIAEHGGYDPKALDSIAAIWSEYDAAESAEARFVKELDKLDTVLQAAEYERQGDAVPDALREFWANAEARLSSPVTRALLDALHRERRGDG